jgi:hypothetical protein
MRALIAVADYASPASEVNFVDHILSRHRLDAERIDGG